MTSISLQKIHPDYFTPRNLENSQIWNRDVKFSAGENYLIVAPSGSGKSTLATAMLGTHFQYSGEIYYDEQKIKQLDLESIVQHRKEGASLLFQDVRLIKDMTLSQNILLRVFTGNPSAAMPKMQSLADALGIRHLLEKKAENCSYGERQRAAIVRSLINPTNFLIYDESFSHLDVANKKIAFDLIDSEAKISGSSVIFFELNEFPFEHSYQILHL